MKNERGYRDPTATIAIGHVMREEKRKKRMMLNEDGEPFADPNGEKAIRPYNKYDEKEYE